MIAFASVSLGSGGLPACTRCRTEAESCFRESAEVAEGIRRAAEHWHHGPGPNIALTGAEAFAHPELPLIVAAARESGVRRLKLTTGGGALEVGENAPGSIQAGVRQVELVLLGGDASVHDALWGREGSLAAAVGGARRFTEAAKTGGVAVALTGRVPVCRHNAASAPSAVAALAAMGAVAVVVEPASGGGFSPDRAWLAAVADTGMVNRAWVAFAGWSSAVPGTSPHLHTPSLTVTATS